LLILTQPRGYRRKTFLICFLHPAPLHVHFKQNEE
jgi:hypothetical protein